MVLFLGAWSPVPGPGEQVLSKDHQSLMPIGVGVGIAHWMKRIHLLCFIFA